MKTKENNWLKSSDRDLSASESLFQAKKYDWCLFKGHLVLEKTLKAIFVHNNENKVPPKTHNLVKLAEGSSLDLTDEQKIFLDEVNDFNLETLYHDYKLEFYNSCTKEFTDKYLTKIKEYYKWLKSRIR